jgi:hypothetical protein
MLLPREQSPWNCGYFLGGIALGVLAEKRGMALDLFGLQKAMSVKLRREVSPTQVTIAASWLFLLGVVKLDDQGRLVKCN